VLAGKENCREIIVEAENHSILESLFSIWKGRRNDKEKG